MKTALVVDTSNMMKRCYHAVWRDQEVDARDWRAVLTAFSSLTADMARFCPDVIIMACDDVCTIRKEFFPAYKAQRTMDAIYQEQRRMFIEVVKKSLPVHVVKWRGYEADDIIANYSAYFSEDGMKTIILSEDQDLLQLTQVYANVSMWSAIKQEWLKPKHPDIDFVSFKALVGDRSDNIPSVTGEKTAVRILEHPEHFDAWLDGGVTKKEKLPRRDVFERNRRMVALFGTDCLMPPIAIDKENLSIYPRPNLTFLQDICTGYLYPYFPDIRARRIAAEWVEWYAKRANIGSIDPKKYSKASGEHIGQ